MPDHYELLGLETKPHERALDPQNIKQAYRQALLLHHPDKVASTAPKRTPSEAAVTIDDIALAYKTLSDPQLRKEYDQSLLRSLPDQRNKSTGSVQHTGLETVDLDSLAFDDGSQTWSRACRCGEAKGFVVTESELEKHVQDSELFVGCKGCSLWLRVLFSVEG